MSIAAEAERFFRARFEAAADAERAAYEKAYMKSQLAFHGVTSAVIRAAARDFAEQHRDLDPEALHAIARRSFATGWFDLRSAAIAMYERNRRQLGEADLDVLLGWVREAACWAHVDWLAVKIIGPIATSSPRRAALLRRWARDEHLWVRRTALLAQLDALKRGEGDFDLFASLAVPMLDEKDFFIRKAIGWVLREVSKKNPEAVGDFLDTHGPRCSGLTYREATKHLPGRGDRRVR